MHIGEWLSKNNKTQADLARVIGRNRVRAHRLVNNGAKPNDDEMPLIYTWTAGAVSANDFYELPKKNGHTKKRSRK